MKQFGQFAAFGLKLAIPLALWLISYVDISPHMLGSTGDVFGWAHMLCKPFTHEEKVGNPNHAVRPHSRFLQDSTGFRSHNEYLQEYDRAAWEALGEYSGWILDVKIDADTGTNMPP